MVALLQKSQDFKFPQLILIPAKEDLSKTRRVTYQQNSIDLLILKNHQARSYLKKRVVCNRLNKYNNSRISKVRLVGYSPKTR